MSAVIISRLVEIAPISGDDGQVQISMPASDIVIDYGHGYSPKTPPGAGSMGFREEPFELWQGIRRRGSKSIATTQRAMRKDRDIDGVRTFRSIAVVDKVAFAWKLGHARQCTKCLSF